MLELATLQMDRPEYSRLRDYVGDWCMRDQEFDGLMQMIAATDLSSHMDRSFFGREKTPEQKRQEKADALAEKCREMSELLGIDFAATDSGLMVAENGLAVIELTGTLMKAESSFGDSTSTVEGRRKVRAAQKNPAVCAVLFKTDSPGGTAAGTQEFADDIAELQTHKPTAAQIVDLGASAAYWLTSQTGLVAMNRSGMAGSIGTFTSVVDSSANAAARGLKVHVIRTGTHKGAGVTGSEITAEQLAGFQQRINDLNSHFLAAVATGRKMSAEAVKAVADGRVFVGQVAVDGGLVDALQGLDQTVGQLMERANPKKKVSVSVPKGVAKMSDPVPATLAELKAKYPKSSAEWREAQQEKGATLAQAADAYADFLQAQIDSRDEQLKKRDEENEDESSNGKRRGVEPFTKPNANGSPDTVAFSGDALTEFRKRQEAAMKDDPALSTFEAASRVAKADPELHTAMLLQTQRKKSAKRIITDTAEEFGVKVK